MVPVFVTLLSVIPLFLPGSSLQCALSLMTTRFANSSVQSQTRIMAPKSDRCRCISSCSCMGDREVPSRVSDAYYPRGTAPKGTKGKI
jgi:hypothetical protein